MNLTTDTDLTIELTTDNLFSNATSFALLSWKDFLCSTEHSGNLWPDTKSGAVKYFIPRYQRALAYHIIYISELFNNTAKFWNRYNPEPAFRTHPLISSPVCWPVLLLDQSKRKTNDEGFDLLSNDLVQILLGYWMDNFEGFRWIRKLTLHNSDSLVQSSQHMFEFCSLCDLINKKINFSYLWISK